MIKSLRVFKTIEDVTNSRPNGSRLTAIRFESDRIDFSGRSFRMLWCQCSCGKEKIVSLASFLRVMGGSKSCGCLHLERVSKFSHYIPQLADCWKHMMERCYNPKCERYPTYGGNGVIVCDEWHDYQVFLDWALANGWEKHLRLDKDFLYIAEHGTKTGMIYSPKYCQFITHQQNIDRTTRSIYFEYTGKQMTIKEISEITGLRKRLLESRFRGKKQVDGIVRKLIAE